MSIESLVLRARRICEHNGAPFYIYPGKSVPFTSRALSLE